MTRFSTWLILLLTFAAPTGSSATELTLIYSGNLDGELEPCGCSEAGDFGGIRRHATLIKQLRQEDPRLIFVSSGGFLTTLVSGDLIRNRYILSGIQQLGYDALGVQWSDVSNGTDFISRSNLPWTISNWIGPEFPTVTHLQRDNIHIHFFNWLDPSQSPYRTMKSGQVHTTSVPDKLAATIRTSKQQGALTILSSTLTLEQAQQTLPLEVVDIVILRSKFEQFGGAQRIGRTLFLTPGSRGQRFGKVLLQLDDQQRITRWRQQIIAIPKSVPNAPELDNWYADYNREVKADYLQRVAVRQQLESGQSPYMGEKTCQDCHAEPYNTWRNSLHSKAFSKLKEVDKTFDPNCLQCHTVGMGKTGGFLDMHITPDLINVQCESCHGAGREHVTSGGATAMPVNRKMAVKSCANCHNHNHSPTFDYGTYWPRIQH